MALSDPEAYMEYIHEQKENMEAALEGRYDHAGIGIRLASYFVHPFRRSKSTRVAYKPHHIMLMNHGQQQEGLRAQARLCAQDTEIRINWWHEIEDTWE